MAGFITYWPKDQMGKLQKQKDNGPIRVAFGSLHTKMPSMKSVGVGDIVYPVTLLGGTLFVVARLPVERIEPAYQYLVRELGNQCGALVPDGVDKNTFYNTPLLAHSCHQKPFSCCAETAAVGSGGSTIKLRALPKESIPNLRFGSTSAKQKALRLDKNGNPAIVSLSGNVRRMSEETQIIFEQLFR